MKESSIIRLSTLTQEQYNMIRKHRNSLRDMMEMNHSWRPWRDQIKHVDQFLEKAEHLYPSYENNYY